MNPKVCEAISKRAKMKVWYNGGTRIIEPHCHGVSTAGNEVLAAFQTSGHSNSGKPFEWKFFDVSKMQQVEILNETFKDNRPLYNPNDKRMTSIHCHV